MFRKLENAKTDMAKLKRLRNAPAKRDSLGIVSLTEHEKYLRRVSKLSDAQHDITNLLRQVKLSEDMGPRFKESADKWLLAEKNGTDYNAFLHESSVESVAKCEKFITEWKEIAEEARNVYNSKYTETWRHIKPAE